MAVGAPVTTYRVPVSDALLLDKDYWMPVEGFRLLSVDGPWLAHPDVTICTFEDDGASPQLAGRLIEPVFQTHIETGTVTILSRQVLNETGESP